MAPKASPKKAVKAGKVEKKVKDPNAPKRPKTGYFFFLDDVRGPTKAKNPGASIGELGKLMGAAWGKLSDAEKAKYNEKNAKDKVRYEKEMAAYKK